MVIPRDSISLLDKFNALSKNPMGYYPVKISTCMSENYFFTAGQHMQKCNDACRYYYVDRIYKNDTHHYHLQCIDHGYIATTPRWLALADISEGAVCMEQADEKLTHRTYKKIRLIRALTREIELEER